MGRNRKNKIFHAGQAETSIDAMEGLEAAGVGLREKLQENKMKDESINMTFYLLLISATGYDKSGGFLLPPQRKTALFFSALGTPFYDITQVTYEIF
ncbi:hypothetical protein [Caproicibacter fermentans]|uniref:Uncharacterized protein n=1 Tax=Caproicibacter fermentans TaxID=2576756 RepID=A0A7G8TD71_9FIRM|nr:hypothetical protein [Caproicibacter fermentans]QNK41562.1 hypothetical protein HCR03_04675 [Caproicibacter fermentans]